MHLSIICGCRTWKNCLNEGAGAEEREEEREKRGRGRGREGGGEHTQFFYTTKLLKNDWYLKVTITL